MNRGAAEGRQSGVVQDRSDTQSPQQQTRPGPGRDATLASTSALSATSAISRLPLPSARPPRHRGPHAMPCQPSPHAMPAIPPTRHAIHPSTAVMLGSALGECALHPPLFKTSFKQRLWIFVTWDDVIVGATECFRV